MCKLLLWAYVLTAPAAFAQHLFDFGIKGGFPLTDIVPETNLNVGGASVYAYSPSKNYIAGIMLEFNLPLGLAIEADALYRPLSVAATVTATPATPTRLSEDIHAAEFPVLLKAHLWRKSTVRPYLEVGPNFRYLGLSTQYLSHYGVAAGAGVDFKLPIIRLSPEIRYSHWGRDAGEMFHGIPVPSSNQNQAEFLIGLSF